MSEATTVYVGLGSNVGDRVSTISRAVAQLAGLLGGPVRVSRLYETEARLDLDQPPFVNAVVTGVFRDSAQELLRSLQHLETRLGRVRLASRPKGPRTIDLDLLLFGDAVVQEPRLIVPHPGIAERRFVLEPLSELAPDTVHPICRLTVRELLSRCPDQGWVRAIDLPDFCTERTVA